MNKLTSSIFLSSTPIVESDYLINANRKSWAETPSEVKEVYGEEYFDAFCQSITTHMRRARSNVGEVVKQMEEAVTSANPKHRYVPYWMSDLRASILGVLSDETRDKFFLSTYKLPTKPAQAPKSLSRQNSHSPTFNLTLKNVFRQNSESKKPWAETIVQTARIYIFNNLNILSMVILLFITPPLRVQLLV